MSIAGFLIAQTMKFFRQWTQGLGQQLTGTGLDRQLPGLGQKQGASDTDNVTDIKALEVFVALLTHHALIDKKLYAPGDILQVGKA